LVLEAKRRKGPEAAAVPQAMTLRRRRKVVLVSALAVTVMSMSISKLINLILISVVE